MATAKIKSVELIKLTLTREEAETLLDVVNRIGGSPTNSPRKHMAAIGSALARVNVRDPEHACGVAHHDNCIYFADFKDGC